MDPESLIATALVAGSVNAASDLLQESARSTVKNLYARLRSRIISSAPEALDANRQFAQFELAPAEQQDLMRSLVGQSAAHRDRDALQLAMQLLQVVDPRGAKEGKYHVSISGDARVGAIGDNANVTQNFN